MKHLAPAATMDAYRYPQYYDIALAPRAPGREVDFFTTAAARFSSGKIGNVFELACGTAPYLEEWHRRGIGYCGLDLSPQMLAAARDKAKRAGMEARFVEADMRALDRGLGRFDLAYVLLGSLYLRSNAEFLDHLDRLAALLPAGGLYLLDSFVWFRIFHDYRTSWVRRRAGVTVRTTYRAEITDPIAQTYDECLTYAVDDHGAKTVISGRVPAKVFFPQEFLTLVEHNRIFEFVGWFNDFSLDAPLRPQGRHIAILRRR
jgi:SAM-dependent methyltransferase